MTNISLNLKASYMYANLQKSLWKTTCFVHVNKHTKLAVMQLKVACTHICKSEQAVFFNILTGKQIKECWQSQYSKIINQADVLSVKTHMLFTFTSSTNPIFENF